MKLVVLYLLAMPAAVLAFTAVSVVLDTALASRANPGAHGLTEILYAFTSAANNNGSAFAGITANTPWLNASLGAAMFLGRLLPIAFVLALAGSLAAQDRAPVTAATLPTHRPQFIGLLIGTILLVSALTYFPVLALGPIAEGLQ
jgi:K+-transporting ATPase ATPase A chain